MELESCYRHPERQTGIHCTRCGNPMCADCMVPAPVGHHCRKCVGEAKGDMRKVRQVRWSAPSWQTPVGIVVRVLLVANIAIFIITTSDASVTARFQFSRPGVINGEYYRLITSAFLHANLPHLIFNMTALWVFGSSLEALLGRVRFLAVYLLSAVGACVATLSFGPAGSVGASGALFGVMGALLAIYRLQRWDAGYILGSIVFGLIFGAVVPNINNVGHMGGLVAGIPLGAGLQWASGPRRRIREPLVFAAAVVILGCGVLAGRQWRSRPEIDLRIRAMEQTVASPQQHGQPRGGP